MAALQGARRASAGGPRVAVVFTGGTISMLPDPESGRAVPTLRGADILARTPGVEAIADVEAFDWGLVPASHLTFEQIVDIARLVDALLAEPATAGAVVVQGTDTLEETAFAWDLLLQATKPVVVVGAMRSASDPGYEGGANLLAAVRAAASPALAGEGVVVVMDGDIWPADDVTKTHTDRYDTFAALNVGPLGRVGDQRLVVTHRRAGRRRLPAMPEGALADELRVELITATVATDGALLRAAVGLGAKGLVVAATGSGNTDPDLLAAAEEAIAAGVVVVHTTRCPSGQVAAGYGFPGGSARWAAAGAIQAGFLGGPKARVALALGLAAGLDREAIAALFAEPARP